MGPRCDIRPAVAAALLAIVACGDATQTPADRSVTPIVPRGYVSRLEVLHEGRRFRFGPFVGYYFRPVVPEDLKRLRFVVFNENRFYTLDLPANSKLFEGDAVFATLPDVGRSLPGAAAADRINPVFFEQAPQEWLRTRPPPADAFVHFHSCYDSRGAVRHGYWLRHVGADRFTYDMGGRVSAGSPLFHRVEKGTDRGFARIVEFDRGPEGGGPAARGK